MNAIQNLVQIMKRGGNPMQQMQQMAAKDPQISQLLRMINGKTPAQMQTMALNMAKERGFKIEDIIRQLGL